MDNPLLFAEDPYRDNPFQVLGIEQPSFSAQSIDFQARQVEKYARAGKPSPETGRLEHPGEAGRAATALAQPAARLAFDLLNFGFPDEEESI